jgi:hypothetical protein
MAIGAIVNYSCQLHTDTTSQEQERVAGEAPSASGCSMGVRRWCEDVLPGGHKGAAVDA